MSFIRRNSKSFCNLHVPKLSSGQKALGGYLLNFSVDFHIHNVSKEEAALPIQLRELTVDLNLKTRTTEKFIGRLFSTFEPKIHQSYESSQDVNHSFSIKLSHSEIEEIEKERNGGEFEFLFKLSGFIFEGHDYYTRAWDDRALRIEQSAWIKVLEQIGYSKILMIEIPTSGEASNQNYTLAHAKLAEAKMAMLRGEWRQTVALCRECLETLPTFPDDSLKVTDESTKLERIQLLQKNLFRLSSLAKHANNDVANNTDWQREDALFMLATCGAMVHKLSKSES